MTRQSASDERAVARVQCKARENERFYAIEIARFLRARPDEVRALLQKHRRFWFLEKRAMRQAIWWTDAQGVALAVVHFRAYQGDLAQYGDRRMRKRRTLKKSRG